MIIINIEDKIKGGGVCEKIFLNYFPQHKKYHFRNAAKMVFCIVWILSITWDVQFQFHVAFRFDWIGSTRIQFSHQDLVFTKALRLNIW